VPKLLAQHGVDHELGELADHAAIVADRGNQGRRHLKRMLPRPADQRFGGEALVGGQVDLRLEMDLQLVGVEVAAQRMLDLDEARGAVVGADVAHVEPVFMFGGKQAAVPGPLQQAAHPDCIAAAPGAADHRLQLRGGRAAIRQVDDHRRIECFTEGGGDRMGDAFVGNVSEQHPDLVVRRDRVAVFGTEPLLDTVLHCGQHQAGMRIAGQCLQVIGAVQAHRQQQRPAGELARQQLLTEGEQLVRCEAALRRRFHQAAIPFCLAISSR